MSTGIDSIAKKFKEFLTESDARKPKGYSTEATVTKIDGKTVWVHIPGGVEETPVKRTIDVAEGDTVQVQIANNRAWIVGNATAPPTDDTKANTAINQAITATEAASKAQEDAKIANTAAKTAQESANRAEASAGVAAAAASAAQTSANQAKDRADEAYISAVNANYSANGALTSLSVVEDVVGTLSWISTHGQYALTTDTAIDPDKIYFVLQDGVYTPVVEPKAEDLATYYELNMDSTMQNYISSHLSLTSEGLWVVNDSNSYKILLSSTGLKVYDEQGNLVSTFGESITYSANRAQTIGNSNAYISFDPLSSTITIGGDVVINSSSIPSTSDVDDAKKMATDYLTNLDNVDGLVIRKDATSNSDFVNIMSNAIRIVTGGVEAFKTWVENSITYVRVGLASKYNILIQSDRISFRREDLHPNLQELGKIEYDRFNRMSIGRSAMGADGYEYFGGSNFSYDRSIILATHKDDDYSRVAINNLHSINLEVKDPDDLTTNGATFVPATSIDITSSSGTEQHKILMESYGEIRMRCRNIYLTVPNRSYYLPDQYCYVYLDSIPSQTGGSYIMKNNGYLTSGASSSKRYKHDILPIQSESLDPHKLYDIEVVQFVYNDDHIDSNDQRFKKKIPGFIAEDIYKHYPIAVDLKDGRPEDWNHRFILPPMLKLIQEQHAEIEALKARVEALEKGQS